MKTTLLTAILLPLLLISSKTMAQPLCFCLRCALPAFESFIIPSGSMKPTLEPDQCMVVGLNPPPDLIQKGKIIVFRHPVNQGTYLSRVVGTGGDTIQLRDGTLILNGDPIMRQPLAPYPQIFQREGTNGLWPRCPPGEYDEGETCMIPRYSETLNGETYEVLDLQDSLLDNTGVFDVLDGYVFVMGDNRDNALDSRVAQDVRGPGLIPVRNVFGIVVEIYE